MGLTDGLVLYRRVPEGLHEIHPPARRQIQSYSTGTERDEEDFASRVELERVHRLRSLFSVHRSIKSRVLEVLLIECISESTRESEKVQTRREEDVPVEELRPLREDDGFDDLACDGLEPDRTTRRLGLNLLLWIDSWDEVGRRRIDLREGKEVDEESPGGHCQSTSR